MQDTRLQQGHIAKIAFCVAKRYLRIMTPEEVEGFFPYDFTSVLLQLGVQESEYGFLTAKTPRTQRGSGPSLLCVLRDFVVKKTLARRRAQIVGRRVAANLDVAEFRRHALRLQGDMTQARTGIGSQPHNFPV